MTTTRAIELVPSEQRLAIRREVEEQHSITRTEDSSGCTRSVCSCGISPAPTNRPQHLGRWDRSHRAFFFNRAVLAAARAIRKANA